MMDQRVYKRTVVLHSDSASGIVEILQNFGLSTTLYGISHIQKDFHSLNEASISNQLSKRFVLIVKFLKFYLFEKKLFVTGSILGSF